MPANPVAESLQALLKDTYSLYLLTHNYHWNVEGPKFVGLHTLFEQHYNELFLAVDEIAERIRALESYALPDDYESIVKTIAKLLNPTAKQNDKDVVADRMVTNLANMHEAVVKAAEDVKKKGEKAGDDETVDLAVRRIQVHQKAIWMLKSIVR